MAQLVERPTGEPKCNADAGSSPRCGKRFFSQPTFSAPYLVLRCPYRPRVPLHALTAVRTLKIPNTGSHIPLLVYTKILHTLIGVGSAGLAAAVPYPCKAIRISRKGKSSTKKKCRSWPYGFQRSRLVLFLGRHEQGPLKRDIKGNQKC